MKDVVCNKEWNNQYNPFNSLKVLAWYERMLGIKDGKFAAPVNIALDILSGSQTHKKCGEFNCEFCMSNLEEVPSEAEIPFDILIKLPKFFNEWGVKSLCVAGHHSDPLIYNNNHLCEFLKECWENKVEVGLVTNGAYFNNRTIEAATKYCKFIGFSINAGNRSTHARMTKTKPEIFDRIIDNIKRIAEFKEKNNLECQIGYKFLITDKSYTSILDGVKLAREIGVNHFQIRPAELQPEKIAKINIDLVNKQIDETFKLEIPRKFEVFGVRHKFNPDYSKKLPECCVASPLGSTWMADGSVVICPDRRWSKHKKDMVLGNFIKEGPEAIREKWGGPEHRKMIEAANKDLQNCIRCTSYAWHEIFTEAVLKDKMDITLI